MLNYLPVNLENLEFSVWLTFFTKKGYWSWTVSSKIGKLFSSLISKLLNIICIKRFYVNIISIFIVFVFYMNLWDNKGWTFYISFVFVCSNIIQNKFSGINKVWLGVRIFSFVFIKLIICYNVVLFCPILIMWFVSLNILNKRYQYHN